jgi:hypothetical protein
VVSKRVALGESQSLMEHTFITGDRPEMVFKSGDISAIVEIETEYQEVGAHQALKYMALMCSERKLDLHAPLVKAFGSLVAFPVR